MKKLFALVALVLGVVSCQTDPNDLDVVVGGEQDVMLTVSLPEATRANSANGFQIADLGSTYDLRYILEVYRVDDEGNILYGDCQRQVKRADAATMSFPVRLAPKYNYQIVAWADIVNDGSDADRLYKTTDGLDAIEILSWNAMDETRDAYTGTKYIADFSSASDLRMELTRPFAKVRVVATDIKDITDLGLSPKAAKVSYLQDMYTKYNAVTAEASAAEAKSHSYTYTSFPYTDATGEMTLFTDYVFVPESGTAKFSLKVYDDETATTRLIKENSFSTDIFVERNKITTIKGDVLTEGGNVSITVDNELGEKVTINVVDTAEALMEQLEQLEDPDVDELNIELGGDIDLDDLFGAGILSTRAVATLPIVIAEGKTLELNLKGFKISAPFEDEATGKHYYAFDNKGTFIVKDSKGGGQIIARGNHNYGTMTLESGSIVACDGNGGYGVRNYAGATFVMNGGSISTSLEDGDLPGAGYDATTLRIDEGATATINGGTINNICNFTLAIDNQGTTTIKGGTFTSVHTTIGNHSTMTIDGGSFTCNGLEGITAHVLWATPGTTTINGGTFDGKDNYNGFNVDAAEGAVVNINGGKFLPVHSGSLYGDGTINVMGGEFFDDPSERVNDDYEAVKKDGVWTIARKADVAKIGEVGYTSLAKAVAAAQNGDTVLFIADVEQEDGVIITDKNITIDLNSNTFTVSNGASTNNRNFKVNGSSVVTIKNGTMVAAGDYSSGAYGTLRTEGTANVTLEDVKLYNYRGNGLNVKALSGTTVTINDTEIYSQYGGGVEAAGGTVELTNVKIEQKGMYTAPYNSMTISVNGGGTATVNSGTYSTECLTAEEANNQGTSHGPWCAGVLNSGGKLIIKDGTFSNDNFGENALATYARGLLLADTGANIQIQGGTFNAVKAIVDIQNNLGDASRNPSATISGGNFSSNPLTWDGLIKVAEGYKVVENNSRWTVDVDPAAKIGETEYASLQEAFNVGGEITLLRDITIAETVVLAADKTAVLNLNGKTISGTMHKNDGAVIKNLGTLTIKNGTISSTAFNGGSTVNNQGTVTIENATLNGATGGDGSWPSYPVNNYSVMAVTNTAINGYHGAVACNAAGETTVTNCTFTKTYFETSSHVFYINHADAKVVVNGGTYSHNGFDGSLAYVNKGEITINDGTFTAKGGGYGIAALTGGKVIVNGGTLPAFLNWGGEIVDNRTK